MKSYLIGISTVAAGLFSIILLTSFISDGDTKEIIFIRVSETGSSKSQIIIQKGAEQEVIQLDTYINKPVTQQTHATAISETLARFISEGYEIDNVSGKGDNTLMLTDYVLVK